MIYAVAQISVGHLFALFRNLLQFWLIATYLSSELFDFIVELLALLRVLPFGRLLALDYLQQVKMFLLQLLFLGQHFVETRMVQNFAKNLQHRFKIIVIYLSILTLKNITLSYLCMRLRRFQSIQVLLL